MRALIVADVHANLEAFSAVIEDAGRRGAIDEVWCLGDLIGYGPDPLASIELLMGYRYVAIAGNHDLAAVGAIGVEDFNPYAAAAARWTAAQLTPELRGWIEALPQVAVLEAGFTLAHGSLIDPVWEYMVSPRDAAAHLARQTTPYGLVGHTHQPRLFHDDYHGEANFTAVAQDSEVALDGARFVANPGSVGQPRDGDPRAAFAIVDTEAGTLRFHRVEYDYAATQAKMVDAGLPEFLSDRLAAGR